MKRKKDKSTKYKYKHLEELSSKSFLGRPSELDKAIEKWTNEGWEVESKRKVRNEKKYNLTLRYEKSPREIAREESAQQAQSIGCTFLIVLVIGVLTLQSVSQNLEDRRNHEATSTRSAYLEATSLVQRSTADVFETRTAVFIAHATETATLWTPTATRTPTTTNTPTTTLTPSNTPAAIRTPRMVTPTTTTYYATDRVNVRSQPNTSSSIIDILSQNEPVEVVNIVENGELVSGQRRWYEIRINGTTAYVHTSLLSRSQIEVAPPSAPNTSSSSLAPVVPIAPPPAQSSNQYTCDCSKTCSNMSCQEAYFQLQVCGCSRRDGDGDGIPCEAQCGG